jgi:hypothetical protein
MSKTEIEVYRVIEFSPDKNYEFALKTRSECGIPNTTKHFTTNPLEYVGKYVRAERRGRGDGGECTYVFDNNGVEIRIELDYEGRSCFREVEEEVEEEVSEKN